MAATLEIHFLTLKYTHCRFCQNYPKKVAKIKLILAKLAFATNYEVCLRPPEINGGGDGGQRHEEFKIVNANVHAN